MSDKYKFKVGQRVRPSKDGIEAHLFRGKKATRSGIVTFVDRWNCPTVLWEGRKTTAGYHPRFIAPDRRKQRA